MKSVLVIGASGFVGGHAARGLLAAGYAVRCLARKPERIAALAMAGCQVVQGDISDPASLQRALAGTEAVYISIQTISPQPAGAAGAGFMDIETAGLQNIVAACRANGVRRLIYVTSLGITADSKSVWLRERWKVEQALLASGLDVTVIRPGMIVGKGGLGFGMTVGQAKRGFAPVLGSGREKMRSIAIDDLTYYLVGVLEAPAAYGQTFEVGNDDLLSKDQMIDAVAGILGRKPPAKFHIPAAVLGIMGPLVERMTKSPRGAISDMAIALKNDLIGDPMPIRAILSRPLQTFRQAAAAALQ